DVARTDHGCGAVEALDALHGGHLREAGRPCPGIDRGRLVAGVDAELGEPEPRTMRVRPGAIEECGQRRPGFGALRSAVDDDVIDEPAFEATPPGPHRDLDAILLHVGAAGQEQAAGW